MNNSFFTSIILTFIFISSLFASNEEVNQKLFELKTSQEYAQKINDEKITLIMGQIIQKENEIKELENRLDELRKDKNSLENYKNIIDRQDKRIEDIHSNLNYWGIGFSLIAILTGLVVFLVNRSYANSAKKEAKLAAEKELKKWIDEKADEELRPKIDEYLNEINKRSNNLLQNIEKKAEDLNNEQTEKIAELTDFKKTLNLENKKVENIENLKNKSESDYTYIDWYNLFAKEFVNDSFQDALKYVNKAIEKAKTDDDKVFSLLGKSITLSRLGEKMKSLLFLDKFLSIYKESKYQEQVSIALVNKAYLLEFVDKEESLLIYDEFIKRFERSDSNVIFGNLSIAYLNSGLLYLSMNNKKKALSIFSNFIEITPFGDNELVNENIIKAINNKAMILNDNKEYKETINILDKSIEYLENKNDDSSLIQLSVSLSQKLIALIHLKKYDEILESKKTLLDKIEPLIKNNELVGLNWIYIKINEAHVNLIKNGASKAKDILEELLEIFSKSKNEKILNALASALLNKIEYSLIENNIINEEDIKDFMRFNKEGKRLPYLDMLIFLRNSINKENSHEVENIVKSLNGLQWSFSELKDWANSFENQEVKERLLKYIDIFENHNKK